MTTAKTQPAPKARKITKTERAKAELAQNKIRRNFKGEEIKSIAQNMAAKSIVIQELDAEKSAVAAQYKSRIDTAKSEMQEAANKITAGFEIVSRECLVVYRPASGEKDLFNPETGEFITAEPMAEPDFQRELRLSKETNKGAKGKTRAALPGEPDTTAELAAAKKDKPKSQGQVADALKKAADQKADAAAKKAAKGKK
jgi:hypothetical protein